MAQTHAGKVFRLTGPPPPPPPPPSGDRFKVIDDQIIAFDRKTPDFFLEPCCVAFKVGTPHVYASLFSENKTPSLESVFDLMGDLDVRLSTAY